MAESVDQSGIVKIVLVEDPLHNITDEVFIAGVAGVGDDLLHHLVDADIGTAVLRALQRADRTADCGIQICAGRTDDDIGEGGVISAAVVRMDHEDRIEDRGLLLRELSVGPEHVENILGDRVIRPGVVDDQRLPVKVMHLGKIGIASDGRDLGHQIDPLEQCLIGILGIRILCVIIEGDRAGLQLVHQVPGRCPENIVSKEIRGQVIAVGETFPEIVKFSAVRQIAEEQQENGLFIPVVLVTVLEEIPDTVAAVDQVTFAGNDISFLIYCVSDNIADLGQTDPDAGPVVVSKAFLDIVFFKKGIWYICIIR